MTYESRIIDRTVGYAFIVAVIAAVAGIWKLIAWLMSVKCPLFSS